MLLSAWDPKQLFNNFVRSWFENVYNSPEEEWKKQLESMKPAWSDIHANPYTTKENQFQVLLSLA